MAFQKYNVAEGIMGSEWVGLKYFQMFFENPFAWRLIKNTLLLGIYSLLWNFPFPIILALLLDQLPSQKFKKVVQTVSYFPYFISMVVVVGILQEFFASDGVINEIRAVLGASEIPFLVDPRYFRSLYIGSGLWQGVGWGSIIYLAALSGVDSSLYEATVIDGAGRWKQTLHVSIPSILPTIVIMLILAIGGLMNVGWEKIVLLYSPTTYETADVISSFVYRRGLIENDFSFSTAVGLFNSLVNFLLIMITNRISKAVTENSLW